MPAITAKGVASVRVRDPQTARPGRLLWQRPAAAALGNSRPALDSKNTRSPKKGRHRASLWERRFIAGTWLDLLDRVALADLTGP